MGKVRYITTNRHKTWRVTCLGVTISEHIDFWHAQQAIPRLYAQKKIDNTYNIEPIRETQEIGNA